MAFWGYGVFNLKPQELYNMDIEEFFEMVKAHNEYEKLQNDIIMQRLAWQTSIIINCMGTLKKKIKPTDLYNSNDDENAKDGYKVLEEDEHKKMQDELIKAFNLDN